MNECEFAARLSAYHDGELAPQEAARVREHLRNCPVCAAGAERLRALSALLGPAWAQAMSPAAMQRLHRRIDRSGGESLRRMAEVLAAAAAVVLLVCTIWLVVLPERPAAGQEVALWEMTAAMHPDAAEAPMSADVEELVALWTARELAWSDAHE